MQQITKIIREIKPVNDGLWIERVRIYLNGDSFVLPKKDYDILRQRLGSMKGKKMTFECYPCPSTFCPKGICMEGGEKLRTNALCHYSGCTQSQCLRIKLYQYKQMQERK